MSSVYIDGNLNTTPTAEDCARHVAANAAQLSLACKHFIDSANNCASGPPGHLDAVNAALTALGLRDEVVSILGNAAVVYNTNPPPPPDQPGQDPTYTPVVTPLIQ